MCAMKDPLFDLEAQVASIEADESTGQLDLPAITSQQRMFVAARVGGLSIMAAAREAGCGKNTGQAWDKDPVIRQYIERYEAELAEHSIPRVRFGIEDAHAMYMKAYHCSATAAEMVKATDSLVKLHKLGDTPATEVPKTVTARQLADLPLSELMRLAGLKVDSLAPDPLEGEFETLE